MILAGDIGGTKTILGIFDEENNSKQPIHAATFKSGRKDEFEKDVIQFISPWKNEINIAVIGAAGPVIQGEADITNLRWKIKANHLKTVFRCNTVHLLNDLTAMAYGIETLDRSQIVTLNKGTPQKKGPISLVAPGTGLGEAFLSFHGDRVMAHPSEGGYVNFAPRTKLQLRLLSYMMDKMDFVGVEYLCSGIGIPNIYDFLKTREKIKESPFVACQFNEKSSRTQIIIESALNTESICPLCQKTISLFLSILASEAGNYALKTLSTGGVFLCGGIPIRLIPLIKSTDFINTFSKKGPMEKMLSEMPLHVVNAPNLALMGAAAYGCQQISGKS